MNCKQCDRKIYGGTAERKRACLCVSCWERTVPGRLAESARRRPHYAGKSSLAALSPGTRVQKVKVELFNNKTAPQYGEIVEAPALVEGNNWEVVVLWDGRSRSERVNARRVQVISNAQSDPCPLR